MCEGVALIEKINKFKKEDIEKYNPYQATKLPKLEKLKKFKKLKEVWDQVRDQVWAQVWDQVRDQVWAQVWDQVKAQVWDQVRDQVGAASCWGTKIALSLPIEHWSFNWFKLGIIVVFVKGKCKVFGKKGMYLGEYNESDIFG